MQSQREDNANAQLHLYHLQIESIREIYCPSLHLMVDLGMQDCGGMKLDFSTNNKRRKGQVFVKAADHHDSLKICCLCRQSTDEK